MPCLVSTDSNDAFVKYTNMVRFKVPIQAIEHKMTQDGMSKNDIATFKNMQGKPMPPPPPPSLPPPPIPRLTHHILVVTKGIKKEIIPNNKGLAPSLEEILSARNKLVKRSNN